MRDVSVITVTVPLSLPRDHSDFLYTTLKIETPDDFPKPPNRLEMIGDLKATLLLKQTP